MLGLVSLFMIDFYMTQSDNIVLISSWALTKSILFIGVLFVLLGIDQAIVRLKLQLQDIFLLVLIQFLVLTTCISIILYVLDVALNLEILMPSLFLMSIVYVLYASSRLEMHYIKSQAFLQGWKIMLFLFLWIYGIQYFEWFLPVSLILSLLVLSNKEVIDSLQVKYIDLIKYKTSLITGLHYFVSLLTLTSSLYFDQLLLNIDTKSLESSILFTHITFFVSPVVIFLGFSGFILGPYLRNNPDKKQYIFKKYFGFFVIVGILLSLASYMIGTIIFHYFKPNVDISMFLSVALISIVFLRYLYIVPSAYIGSFASNLLIRKISIVNVVGLAIYLICYFLISRMTDDYMLAIICAMVLVWSIRILNGYYAVFLILKKDSHESV